MRYDSFLNIIGDDTSKYHKIKKEDYQPFGLFPIIDQGQEFIGGYTDNEKLIAKENLPVIIFGDHTKNFKFVDFPFTIGADGVKVLTLKNQSYNTKFYYYFLKTLRLTNAGYSRHFKYLRVCKLPIPDNVDNQRQIANILTNAENLISQRKESIRLLDEFLKSTFLEMVGDPGNNEKGWKQDKVITYADCIVPGRDKPKSFSGNIPWFTTDDLIHNSFVLKSNKGLGLSLDEIKQVKARIIPTGSVLMTCVGDLGVLSICKEDCVVNQQLHTFQCKIGMNNIFLMYALSFQIKFMYKNASTTTVAYMNKTICNSIPVIKPPIELQTRFAHIVEKIEALKIQYKQSLEELGKLYGSLSQKAFRGELSFKDEGLMIAAEPEAPYSVHLLGNLSE